MTEAIHLTAIEVGWPERLRETSRALDRFGYRGYWLTEHYGHGRSASPAVFAGIAAASASSDRFRVGSAAVLLSHHRPFKVACDFVALESQFPGRVDLGIAGGITGEPTVAVTLGSEDESGGGSFEARAAELVRLVRLERGPDGSIAPGLLGPRVATTPTVWVCGTGERSARLAATLGVGYAMFANMSDPDRSEHLADSYRQWFRPSATLASPKLCVGVHGLCSREGFDAREFWRKLPLFPGFVGDASCCRDQLVELARRFGTRDIAIASIAPTYEMQLHSYEQLASALDACSARDTR